MTVEELKAEADKLGYNIVKKTPYVKKLPCPRCGKKSTHMMYLLKGGYIMKCNYCDFHGHKCDKKKDANTAWNDAVKEVLGC